jgi:uncharacterized protein (DUF885 family)
MPYSRGVLPRDFLEAHLAAHPEDAATLGITGYVGSLPPPTCRAAEEETQRCREVGLELADRDDAALDVDIDAMHRVALFYARYSGNDGDASNLELAALPNAILQHAALHARSEDDWNTIARGAAKVPAFLEQHAENLRRGTLDGRSPDADVAKVFVERVLPRAADAIGGLPFAAGAARCPSATVAHVADAARAAAEAYRSLLWTVELTIAPSARVDVVLGEEETAYRLHAVMGADTTTSELVAEAREDLARVREKLDRDALMKVLAERPSSLDDTLATYRRWIAEATNFVRDRELVPIAGLRLALDLEPLPGGIADSAAVTNWPAPLFAADGKGHVLYSTDPSTHLKVAMKNLAVHEGIPGHYLQSVYWQRNAKPEHACRYLGVADDVAFARGYFGAMLSIEGWAVHMEQLLRQHGFYDTKEEQLFFDFCDAIRATRVVLDLELQRGRMTAVEATRFVADATMMPEAWASAQVVRAKRLPLQGLTYRVGACEIARLRKSFRGDELAFHDALLALGPVPPSRAARAIPEFRVK